jgi:hypothetical protein
MSEELQKSSHHIHFLQMQTGYCSTITFTLILRVELLSAVCAGPVAYKDPIQCIKDDPAGCTRGIRRKYQETDGTYYACTSGDKISQKR